MDDFFEEENVLENPLVHMYDHMSLPTYPFFASS